MRRTHPRPDDRPPPLAGWWRALLVALSLLAGCPAGDEVYDFDGDGSPDTADCAAGDPAVYPGAPDPWGDGVDQDCDGLDGQDRDGDGFPANAELAGGDLWDCNDGNVNVHPGVAELLNGVDDDCDGWVDEGTGAFDDDGDGFCEGVDFDGDGDEECSDGSDPGDCDDGDPALEPSDRDGDGRSTCTGDCDDLLDVVLPGADEVCDGRDNDCDGLLLPGEADEDGDGVRACDGDCDDADPAVSPSEPEVCDGLDNDCDPQTAEAVDVDGDGLTLCEGDCGPLDPTVLPGAREICDGLDNDCDGPADEACTDCDLEVPGDASDPQAALDAALPGALVCLGPGTWYGALDFGGLPIRLLGTAGPGLTVLDGLQGGSVVSFVSGEGAGAILEGLTITGGDAEEGGGIRVAGASSPTLRDLVITGNTATSGGGVHVSDLSSPTLTGVLIEGNAATGGGGGYVALDSLSDLSDTVVEGNLATHGGGLEISGGSGSLLRVTIAENTALASTGGGIEVLGANASLDQVRVLGNTSGSRGGGVVVALGGSVVVRWFLAAGNSAAEGGGAIYLSVNGALSAQNAIIAGNTGGEWGGGVWNNGGTLVLTQASLFGNSALSGAATWSQGAPASLASSVVAGNLASNGTVGWYAIGPQLLDNVFWSNSGSHLSAVYSGSVDVATYGTGNQVLDPALLQTVTAAPSTWDLHLGAASAAIDAGSPALLDPDGSPADPGAWGGPDAGGWDLDGDGSPAWWHPGPYDPAVDPALGWDCDDEDPTVSAASGC